MKDLLRCLVAACAFVAAGSAIAAAHLSFPGIGQLRAEGRGYTFIPANYSSGR